MKKELLELNGRNVRLVVDVTPKKTILKAIDAKRNEEITLVEHENTPVVKAKELPMKEVKDKKDTLSSGKGTKKRK